MNDGRAQIPGRVDKRLVVPTNGSSKTVKESDQSPVSDIHKGYDAVCYCVHQPSGSPCTRCDNSLGLGANSGYELDDGVGTGTNHSICHISDTGNDMSQNSSTSSDYSPYIIGYAIEESYN